MRKSYTKGPITLREIFNNTLLTKTHCWEWQRSIARNGYGQIRRNGKLVTVTRLVMHLCSGFSLSSKLSILHHCDNPKCVNPDHLYVGTYKDNAQDKVKRKRHNFGTKVHTAKLSDIKVKKIFLLKAKGWSARKIANTFGVSHSAVDCVLQRRTWKHVQLINNNGSKYPETKE